MPTWRTAARGIHSYWIFFCFRRIINKCKREIFVVCLRHRVIFFVLASRFCTWVLPQKAVRVLRESAVPFHVFFFCSFFLLSLTEYVLVKRENVSFSAHFETTANTFSFEREFLSVNIYVMLRGGEKKKKSLSSTQSEKMPGWRAAAARGDEILYLALNSIGNISLMVKLSVFVRLHEINVYQSSLQVCWDTFFFFFATSGACLCYFVIL